MKNLNVNEIQQVSGGAFSFDGCSLPSFGDIAIGYGVGGGTGMTIGAATGFSSAAAAGGFIGTALAGSFMGGYSLGVGINHLFRQCE